MNLIQLKQIINKNKSLIFIFSALLIEGLLILISLRLVKNYLTSQEYSDLTLYYSIISIVSFGLFAGLEQARQSKNSKIFNIYNSLRFSIISLLFILPFLFYIFQNTGLKNTFIFFAIIYALSYSIQFEIFGFTSFTNKFKSYSYLKVIDGLMKVVCVIVLGYSFNSLDSFIIGFSIAPSFALIIFILKSKIKIKISENDKEKISSYINLTIQNFICIFYLYGLPLTESLKNKDAVFISTDIFFAQAYAQILQFCLAPIQFLYLPKLTKEFSDKSKFSIQKIFEGSLLALLISSIYLIFSYVIGNDLIKLVFFDDYSLSKEDTFLVSLISVIILLTKTSAFYLIVVRKTKYIAFILLFGFIFFVVVFYLFNFQTIYIFIMSCTVSLVIIFFTNLQLIKND
tara:strand:+ start:1884 stop:3083 length:1200 start_codon:yes stop_codon:yes gene_type:complete